MLRLGKRYKLQYFFKCFLDISLTTKSHITCEKFSKQYERRKRFEALAKYFYPLLAWTISSSILKKKNKSNFFKRYTMPKGKLAKEQKKQPGQRRKDNKVPTYLSETGAKVVGRLISTGNLWESLTCRECKIQHDRLVWSQEGSLKDSHTFES